MEEQGKWRAGGACFLTKTFKCAVCSKESGWAARLSHLPMVSENDKAGKVRKKGKNDIIYSRLGVSAAAKQSRSTIIHQSFRLSVRKEGVSRGIQTF